MAKQLKEIFTASDKVQQTYTINAWHVSQSVDALTGADAYDIKISGSLKVTGSVSHNLIPNANGVAASVLVRDNATGEYKVTGSYTSGGGGSINTGSLLTTASLSGDTIIFEKGDGTTFNITVTSVTSSISSSYSATASHVLNPDYVSNVTYQTGSIDFTGVGSAFDGKLNINDLTSSLLTTSSFNNATGSFLTTGSVTNNTITFTKGDGTTFVITVDTGSGGGGSTDYISNVVYQTGSIDFTGVGSGFDGVININALTASLISNDDTGSFMTTGSVSGNTITFTKGDGTTFDITIVSSSYAVSSSFAVTASHVLNPDYVSNVTYTGGVVDFTGVGSAFDGDININALTASLISNDDTGSFLTSGSFSTSTNTITLYSDNTNHTLDLSSLAGGGGGGFAITASDESSVLTLNARSFDFVGNAVTATNVGNAVTVTIATGSLNLPSGLLSSSAQIATDISGAFDTGSFLTTGSVSGDTITFEKGDGTTFTLTISSVTSSISSSYSATASHVLNPDYVSNVTYAGGIVDFTGVGSAFDGDININALTASLISNDDTGSFLTTGSVTNNTITFTKGDGTTFNLTVNTGSGGGGSVNTGSLLTTGSMSGNTLTFTKGDGTTFDITVLSSSYALNSLSASYATNALSASYGPNIYNVDGILTGNRTVSSTNFNLTFDNTESSFSILSNPSTGRVYISDLTSGDKPQVIGLDSNGRLFAMNTSSIAGGGSTTPDTPLNSIQFNEDNTFGGAQMFYSNSVANNQGIVGLNTQPLENRALTISSSLGVLVKLDSAATATRLQFVNNSSVGNGVIWGSLNGDDFHVQQTDGGLQTNLYMSSSGEIHFPRISNSNQQHLVAYDSANGEITYVTSSTYSGGGSISAPGNNREIIFNDNGDFGASGSFTFQDVFSLKAALIDSTMLGGNNQAYIKVSGSQFSGIDFGGAVALSYLPQTSEIVMPSSGTGRRNALSLKATHGGVLGDYGRFSFGHVYNEDTTFQIIQKDTESIPKPSSVFRVYNSGSNNVRGEVTFNISSSGAIYAPKLVNTSNSNYLHYNSTTGEITYNAGAPSDKRLKDNITPISNPIEKLSQIEGYEFDWNISQSSFTGHDVGVVAQEIESILPELVSTQKDGYKVVKYDKLTAFLISVVKEQQTQIEDLQTRISNLEN